MLRKQRKGGGIPAENMEYGEGMLPIHKRGVAMAGHLRKSKVSLEGKKTEENIGDEEREKEKQGEREEIKLRRIWESRNRIKMQKNSCI